jgi:hypothetical protein
MTYKKLWLEEKAMKATLAQSLKKLAEDKLKAEAKLEGFKEAMKMIIVQNILKG